MDTLGEILTYLVDAVCPPRVQLLCAIVFGAAIIGLWLAGIRLG